MEARRFYVITGGTMVHVAPHFSLCAPAYGRVGAQIADALYELPDDVEIVLLRTKMARGNQKIWPEERAVFDDAGIRFLETNEDLEKLIDHLVFQPETKGIVMAAAVCDWQPQAYAYWDDAVPDWNGLIGKNAPRLQTSRGTVKMSLTPADKIIGKIRKTRKDIFLVGFKATAGMSEQEQYVTGLGLLKGASCNLVFANDVHEHRNMVITPEEAKYHVTKDRKSAVKGLCEMIAMRSQLHFTRSTVVDGEPVPWDSEEIPDNLRKVVNHLIARGAYKPFKGKTVGHFATRGPKPGVIYTSRRKTDFNRLPEDGLLRIEAVGDNRVVAYGAKPSVGGQSQRIIFDEHPDVDCIVHAHVPMKQGEGLAKISVREQRPFECGSTECGRNASSGLREVWWGTGDSFKAVMLDEHGPNVCFSRDTDPDRVIEFIEEHFDLTSKTGGPVQL